MPENNTLLLVDGSSYLYRAFHAMPDLRADPQDRNSAPTGAIRGMVNMLTALENEVPAQYRAVVFDASGDTFRNALYPEYKAHRNPMPDDLRAQIAPIHQVIELLGWTVLVVPDVEADDVLGTLAVMGREQGLKTVISSGDKDLAQLVNDDVLLMDTMNGKRRDVAGVQAEFGVTPAQMLDFQTLMGDAIDNVPGVAKVGPKTAAKWLAEYGTLANIMANHDKIKGAVGENLRAALDWLPKGQELLKIKVDCELDEHIPGLPQLNALSSREQQTAALRDFYTQYGFKGLAAKLGGASQQPAGKAASTKAPSSAGQTAAQAATTDMFAEPEAASAAAGPTTYETISTWAALDAWLAILNAASLTALDTETTSLNNMQAQIVGLSVCVAVGKAAYIPLAHDYPGAPLQLPREAVLAKLKPWLEDSSKPKLGANVKYDSHSFANHGILVQGWQHDVMLQSYVLEVHRPHGLESLAKRHINREGLSYEALCGKGVNQISISQVAIEQVTQYACEDVDFTLDVHLQLWPRLQHDAKLRSIYELEIASSATLLKIERNGIAIDADNLRAQSHDLGGKMLALEETAHTLAGRPFNLSSPKQLGEILFSAPPDGLGLPVVKKTSTGAASTDEEVLEKLAEDYPLPAALLNYRSLAKLKGTYTDKLPLLINPQTGRVHTNYAQAVAVTGRLSSNEPNLQNIPIRTAEGRRVREAFVARPGCLLASADYSQIELRIMAHLSGDEALIHAFTSGQDVHRATAAEVFGLQPEAVSSEQRRYAKVINFGLIYGMSAYGLAKNLAISPADAKAYIDRYFVRYPGVKRYMDDTKALAKEQGYVETVFGRRLYLPEINSPNGPRRAGAERAAINAPMQGTAADLIKLAMNAVQSALEQAGKQTLMVLQVHDELVFDVPPDEVDWLRATVPPLMAGVAQLRVPLLAELGVGENWEKAH